MGNLSTKTKIFTLVFLSNILLGPFIYDKLGLTDFEFFHRQLIFSNFENLGLFDIDITGFWWVTNLVLIFVYFLFIKDELT